MFSYLCHNPLRRSITLSGHYLNVGDITSRISVHDTRLNLIDGAKVLHFFDLKKGIFFLTHILLCNAHAACACTRTLAMQFTHKTPARLVRTKSAYAMRTRERGV